METSEYLEEAIRQFRGLKKTADRALAQTDDADFFAAASFARSPS